MVKCAGRDFRQFYFKSGQTCAVYMGKGFGGDTAVRPKSPQGWKGSTSGIQAKHKGCPPCQPGSNSIVPPGHHAKAKGRTGGSRQTFR